MRPWPITLALLTITGCAEDIAVPDGYPSGDYGTDIGDVFGYFAGQAYAVEPGNTALASQSDFASLDMLDVQSRGPSHVLMHLAAMW